MSFTTMELVIHLFSPLIGQLVWQVRRGIGTFLTLEFGAPHLSVREPIVARSGASPKVRRNLKRRGVYVTGDWHLWVQYGDWRVSTADGVLQSCDPFGTPLDDCLRDLDGQRLVSVGRGGLTNSCSFKFDLGGVLEIWPSTEIIDDQWVLHTWNGDIASYQSDGELVFHRRDEEGDGVAPAE